jgi:hypothetical protein
MRSPSLLIEQFLMKASETLPEFAVPNLQDEEDIKILMKRVIGAMDKGNVSLAVDSLKQLDKTVREFKHENFAEDFYDFISDQDIWGKVYQIATPPVATDLRYLEAMKDLMSYFLDQPLFK